MTRKSLQPRAFRRTGLVFVLAALITSMPAGLVRADEFRQKQRVGSFDVSLSVWSPTEVARSTGKKFPAAADEHFFMVSILRPSGGNPVLDADVTANVTEAGFAGLEKPMPLTAVGNEHLYANYFAIFPGKAYRVIVHIGGPKFERILEAQFQYRHHH